MAQEGYLNYGNMTLVIDVQGHYRDVGTLAARINFMSDGPSVYPEVVFTPIEGQTLNETEVKCLYELMRSLSNLRERIGIKAGHMSLHTKEPEDYLRV